MFCTGILPAVLHAIAYVLSSRGYGYICCICNAAAKSRCFAGLIVWNMTSKVDGQTASTYFTEGLLHALEVGLLVEVIGHRLGHHGLDDIHHQPQEDADQDLQPRHVHHDVLMPVHSLASPLEVPQMQNITVQTSKQ